MRVVLDIETNGLDRNRHVILEVGAIAINDDLTERVSSGVASSLTVILHAGKAEYEAADDFVRDMHTKNGLWDACNESDTSRHEADEYLASWLEAHGASKKDLVILCGHTIDFDHGFLMMHFPLTAAVLHYRKDDIGSAGRFARECCGLDVQHTPKEAYPHRGLADCWLELEDARALRRLLMSTQAQP